MDASIDGSAECFIFSKRDPQIVIVIVSSTCSFDCSEMFVKSVDHYLKKNISTRSGTAANVYFGRHSFSLFYFTS